MPTPDPWIIRSRSAPAPRLRLFCVPCAGRGAALYRGWPEFSGGEMELCAMQLPGRESRFREPPFTRMSDAVEQAAEVLERRLDLPYALSATAWERYFVLSWRAFCAAVTGSGRFVYSFRRGGHPSS